MDRPTRRRPRQRVGPRGFEPIIFNACSPGLLALDNHQMHPVRPVRPEHNGLLDVAGA